MRAEPPAFNDSSDEEAKLEEMTGLVDILRDLVHQHLPHEIEPFEILLVDFATFWSHGDAVRRVLHASWKVLPVASRRREARFIAEAAALGRCTATEARALIELDYGGVKEWRVRRALRRASIQRAEARQFDRGKDLLDRLPRSVWTPRASRARELWTTARHQAAAGRAAATALDSSSACSRPPTRSTAGVSNASPTAPAKRAPVLQRSASR